MIFYEGEEKTTREIFYRERRMIREDWNRKKEEKRQKELEIVRRNERGGEDQYGETTEGILETK